MPVLYTIAVVHGLVMVFLFFKIEFVHVVGVDRSGQMEKAGLQNIESVEDVIRDTEDTLLKSAPGNVP